MHLIYSILTPLLILGLNYLVMAKPLSFERFIHLLFRSLPHLFGYILLLYYLSVEYGVDVTWAPITLITFLTPIAILVIILKLFFWVRNRKKSTT